MPHHQSDADAHRDDRMASSVFLLPDRCMLFTAMAGVPDLSAMSRSCSSMMARAGASPSRKVRSGQLAALAHNVVGERLPLIEIAHSGALNCGNMDEYVRSAVGRLNEAKTPL